MPTANIQEASTPAHEDAALAEAMAQLAAQVAVPLTQALQRVVGLAQEGSIDRAGLAALLAEIGNARRAGLMGQQIARFANGQARPAVEEVAVDQVLRRVLDEHTAQAASGTVGHHLDNGSLLAMGDVSLVHTLLQAAVGWTSQVANEPVQWRVDTSPWQGRPGLIASLRCASSDASDAADGEGEGDASLDWLLMSCAARLAGVTVALKKSDTHRSLSLGFRHSIRVAAKAASHDAAQRARRPISPLSGCQVLVLAVQPGWRRLITAALEGHDVFIDQVSTVEAAARYCDDGSPQALIYERRLDGTALQALKARLSGLSPAVALLGVGAAGPSDPATQAAAMLDPAMDIAQLQAALGQRLIKELNRQNGSHQAAAH